MFKMSIDRKYLASRIRRWFAQIRPWPALFLLFIVATLFMSTIWTRMTVPGRAWDDLRSWKTSLFEILPIFVCALILRYEEKFRKFLFSRGPSRSWELGMAALSRILDGLRPTSAAI